MAETAPDPFRIHLVECRRRIEAGDAAGAVSEAQAVLAVQPDHPDANYLMGIAQAHLRDRAAAIAYLERADRARPGIPLVMSELARAYEHERRDEEALALHEQILSRELRPGQALDVTVRRGITLARLERYDEAADALRAAAERAPQEAAIWHNLGNVLGHLEDREGAVAAFRKAAELAPDNAAVLYALGRALLWTGSYTESVERLDAALARAPGELQIVSYKILALRHAGRTEEADALEGLDDMILEADLSPPPGYGSLAEWNAALRDEILRHPGLTTETKGRATRHGAKLTDLFTAHRTPVFAAFETQIRAGFEDLLARMPRKAGHPLPLAAPEGYVADMWANVMYDGGHQAPHNHPRGWFSGCYYVALPDRVTESGAAHEGWIEFGGTAYDFPEPPGAPRRLIQPAPGRLVVFPSYIFHRTIPFASDQVRISCAFDAKPEGGGAGRS